MATDAGEDALDLAASEDWRLDMVIANHRLGSGLSGVAAAKEIAGRASHAFPTLALMGYTAKERIVEIRASLPLRRRLLIVLEAVHQSKPAFRVRREKAALSSGCETHPATAPAGSNRGRHGGDEMSEALD